MPGLGARRPQPGSPGGTSTPPPAYGWTPARTSPFATTSTSRMKFRHPTPCRPAAVHPGPLPVTVLVSTPGGNMATTTIDPALVPDPTLFRQRVAALYEDALVLARHSKTKASLLKLTSLLTSVLVILLGLAIAILAVFDFTAKEYLLVIMGCLVAAVKAAAAVFNPEYR